MNSMRRWRWLIPVLVTVGSGVSVYLLADSAAETIPICSAVFGADCDETLLSPTSWQLGLPLAGWGVIYFGILATLLILRWSLSTDFERETSLATVGMATGGVIISCVLMVTILGGSEPFCPLCIVVHAINLTLLPLLWKSGGFSFRQLPGMLKEAVSDVLGGSRDSARMFPWKVMGFCCVGLLAIVLYQWILIEVDQHATAGRRINPRELITEYDETTPVEIPVDPIDPRRGPIDAPVQLVVFSDFQCTGCQMLSRELGHLTLDFGEDLCITFKHYPLGTACNPALSSDKHPAACAAARAAEAAHRQGHFWEYHDALFDPDQDNFTTETFRHVAEASGLDRPTCPIH